MSCSVHQPRGITGPCNSSRETHCQARNRTRVTRALGMHVSSTGSIWVFPSHLTWVEIKWKMPQDFGLCPILIYQSLKWQYSPSFGPSKLVWLLPHQLETNSKAQLWLSGGSRSTPGTESVHHWARPGCLVAHGEDVQDPHGNLSDLVCD